MLPKQNRLTRLEVDEIKHKKTTPFSGRFFGLVKLNQPGEPKFAVLISKKLSKSAVVRNHIRRVVFDAIYPIMDKQEGWHLFLAKKNAVNAEERDILNDVVNLLKIC